MQSRIELLSLTLCTLNWLHGIISLETVLLQGSKEDSLSHLETGVQLDQFLVGAVFRGDELIGGDGIEGTVEVIYGVQEVCCEFLDAELFRGSDVALSSSLEVLEVSD